MSRTYLDHNAGSPLRPEALEAMIRASSSGGGDGNPSAGHESGRRARGILESSREELLDLLDAPEDEYEAIFVSGGSEACNTAIRVRGISAIAFSALEHAASEAAIRRRDDIEARLVPISSSGVIDLEALDSALSESRSGGALICLSSADNENGARQPVVEASRIARRRDGILFVDAVQSAGKEEVSMRRWDVDVASLSSRKFGGPQGCGALIVRRSLDLDPLLVGGGQEGGRRAGGENVLAAAGTSAALRAAKADLPRFVERVGGLRDRLEREMASLSPTFEAASSSASRLPHASRFSTLGGRADVLAMRLDQMGVDVGIGAACDASGSLDSPTLRAMGVSWERRRSALRVSLGWNSVDADVDHFLESWSSFSRSASQSNGGRGGRLPPTSKRPNRGRVE